MHKYPIKINDYNEQLAHLEEVMSKIQNKWLNLIVKTNSNVCTNNDFSVAFLDVYGSDV